MKHTVPACSFLGHFPMRFSWGFDEEDEKCVQLKRMFREMVLDEYQKDIRRFLVVVDCGIGLYAGEEISRLRAVYHELELICVIPHEEQAVKWAPYLRDRYFALLECCTEIQTISLRRTATCELEAYRKIVDDASMTIAVYDPESRRGDVVDQAILYATAKGQRLIFIHPDSMAVSPQNETASSKSQ